MCERDSHVGSRADVLSTRDSPRPAGSFTPLVYGGGPIILEPELVSVFWGPFTDADIAGMQAYLRGFVRYLAGELYLSEGYAPVVWQYGVVGGTVGPSCVVSEAPRQATDAEVRSQLRCLQRQGYLPPFSPQRLFLVFTRNIQFPNYGAPPPDGFCAYHDQCGPGQYYALCPFPAVGGCGSGSPIAGWQSLTCHEILEAATDPSGSGGWTAKNEEGADFCNWQEVRLPFGTVQRFEDNQQHQCSVFTATATAPDPVEHGVLGDQTFYTRSINSARQERRRAVREAAGAERRRFGDTGLIAPGATGWYTVWDEEGAAFGKASLFTAALLPEPGSRGAADVEIAHVQSALRETGGRQVTVTVRNHGPQAVRVRIFHARRDRVERT